MMSATDIGQDNLSSWEKKGDCPLFVPFCSLTKTFRGELVPQDPNDEPASQLLERIKLEKASLEAGKKEKGKAGRKTVIRKKEATEMAKKKERRPLVEVLESFPADETILLGKRRHA